MSHILLDILATPSAQVHLDQNRIIVDHYVVYRRQALFPTGYFPPEGGEVGQHGPRVVQGGPGAFAFLKSIFLQQFHRLKQAGPKVVQDIPIN
jgi:hypothetical protein